MPQGAKRLIYGYSEAEPKTNPVAELVALSSGGTPRRDGTHMYSGKASRRAADLMAALTYEDARAYSSQRGRRSGFDPIESVPLRGGQWVERQGQEHSTGVMSASDRAAYLTRVGGWPSEREAANRYPILGALTGGTLAELTGGGMSVLAGRARTKRAAGRVTEPLAVRRTRMKRGERSRASRLLSTGEPMGAGGVLG
jgi:hypothetical protein